jgi:hypothetical protein
MDDIKIYDNKHIYNLFNDILSKLKNLNTGIIKKLQDKDVNEELINAINEEQVKLYENYFRYVVTSDKFDTALLSAFKRKVYNFHIDK